MGQTNTAGQPGPYIQQLITTGGKLQLARAAALMDLRNAEVALKRAETDLVARVRAGYFGVLVARSSLESLSVLTKFTDEFYIVMVEQLRAAKAAPYEPAQMRALAYQSRASLAQARNRYLSAWRQLAGTLGLPDLPPTSLEGSAEVPVPCYDYETVRARVLEGHTEVQTAQNALQRSRYNLKLAQVTLVPDVTVNLSVQKDYTSVPSVLMTNITLGMPVPLWDKNKGNILQAQAQLLRAGEEEVRVRADLSGRVAEAFGRYQSNRQAVAYYREQLLADQVRAYLGTYLRHQQEPDDVKFSDVVTAQQTLVTAVTTYLSALNDQWTAVVDVANLLQTPDLFGGCEEMMSDASPKR
jgi:cobalt-zinc-cadmium efflux system outer membrane protein